MATTYRGRGGARSRSTSQSYWGHSTRDNQGGWGGTTASTRRGTKVKGSYVGTPPAGYRNVSETITRRMSSYRTLFQQIKGPAKYDRPSPATINTFANWINKGAFVQTVTKAQLNRWARTTKFHWNNQNPSPTTCKNVLWAKFGKTTIKAVARTKTGSFMVATAPMWNGKWFTFPK